tara:strand:+ start:227 stop:520 length:294 start_codon:yes stop_codon:yes gene_type:complete
MTSLELVDFNISTKISFDDKTSNFYIQCPHCNAYCSIHKDDIRCTIFRHAVYKKDFSFVHPHATQDECEYLVDTNQVYGCGKPFIFNGNFIKKCGYI